MAKKQVSKGGSESMKNAGLKGVLIGFTVEAHQKIKVAAALKGQYMNEFIQEAAENAATKAMEEFKHKT